MIPKFMIPILSAYPIICVKFEAVLEVDGLTNR